MFLHTDQFGAWSDGDESSVEADGECAGSGHNGPGHAGACATNTAGVQPGDAVDGGTAASGEPASKKRGRKPRKTATESASGEEKAKRAKHVPSSGADKEARETASRVVTADSSDNATFV